jgi:dihydrolipoamide dehydrogenase
MARAKTAAKNIAIAMGSDTARLPRIEIDGETIVFSTGALSLQGLPGKLLVVGQALSALNSVRSGGGLAPR